jgi:ABC-2 type transport system permease protein
MPTLLWGLNRAQLELRTFFRQRDALAFTLAMPVLIMVVLCSVFGRDVPETGFSAAQLLAAGLIAGGVASTSFVNLTEGITTDRENGALKRLRGTPIPASSYFLGKVAVVLVASLVEVAIMLAVAVGFFDLALPPDLAHWLTFAWVFVLGVIGCSLTGIALSALARTTSGAAAMSTLSLVVLQFASGIYVLPITRLPAPMTAIGSVFPLKWMAQGFRSAFLPDSLASRELAGTWEHGRVALVLAAWCVGGLVLCLTTFRWRGRRER